MKLLFFAAVAALTLVSVSSAAVRPRPLDYIRKVFEARLPKGAVPHGEEFEQFWELFIDGYYAMYFGYDAVLGQIFNLVETEKDEDTETLSENIRYELINAVNNMYNMLLGPMFRDPSKPMSQIATDFQDCIVIATLDLTTMKFNIERLVKVNHPGLLPQLELIFVEATAMINSAWTPTAAFLKPFLPSQ